jgi:hypothetical protein
MLEDFNQLRLFNPSKPGGGQGDNRIVNRFHQECVKTEKVAWHEKCENLPTAIWHIPIAAGQAPANGKASAWCVTLLCEVHRFLDAFLFLAECLKEANVILGEGYEVR